MPAADVPDVPVTQIIYIDIAPDKKLEDTDSPAGKAWSQVLDVVQDSPGFKRLYWGRRLEEPEKVQLHIVRDTLQHHKAFLASPAYQQDVLRQVRRLAGSMVAELPLAVRHVYLTHQVLDNPLGGQALLGYPIGSAIYSGADDAWYDGAWPLWTHVVRHVDGCKGIAGGKVVEPVCGLDNGYLVYVGWETVKHHDDYHHTKHFMKHRVILQLGHSGYSEYGHVIFKGTREGPKANL